MSAHGSSTFSVRVLFLLAFAFFACEGTVGTTAEDFDEPDASGSTGGRTGMGGSSTTSSTNVASSTSTSSTSTSVGASSTTTGSSGSSGSGGSGGMGGARTDAGTRGTSTLGAVLSESLFNQIFPRRNSFYTYASLIDAAKKFPSFASEGTQDQRKQELAAFFGNVARETGELRYIEQIAKDLYCSPGAYPCTPGQQYYGRGPLQISWNYNYGACGTALGLDLLNNPGLVASNPTVSWQTALWFWTQSNPTGVGTCHSAMLEGKGFGMTIRIINGGVECDGKATDAVQDRISHYQSYCAILSVSPGSNLSC